MGWIYPIDALSPRPRDDGDSAMTYINPLAGALAQSSQVQRLITDDKDRQIRRVQTLRRNSAASGDRVEHEVESTDAVILQSDEEEHADQQRKRKKRPPPLPNDAGGEEPGPLDLTA